MIELFFVILLGNKLGAYARSKGYPAGRYRLLLIAYWIVGEFLGAFVGYAVLDVLLGEDAGPLAYVSGLIGAFLAGKAAFARVDRLPNRAPSPAETVIPTCRQCGEPLSAEHAECPVCGTPAIAQPV